MKLVDVDMLTMALQKAYVDGLIGDMDDVFGILDGEPRIEAIPTSWLKRQYPSYARYSSDGYQFKVKIIHGLIREYQDYLFNQQIHNVIEDIDDERE